MRIVLPLVAALALGCSGSDGAGGLRVPIPDGGQVFPNLTLQGFRSAAATDALEPISTWELHDPDRQRYDLLHFMVIAMWCPHCNNETADVMKITDWQSSHRVGVEQIAIQGYTGKAPSLAEMQGWARKFAVNFPVLVDGQAAELGKTFDVTSVPLNIMVNPRTMGVLAIDLGEVGDVESYERGFLP
jgi:hypothetical protein